MTRAAWVLAASIALDASTALATQDHFNDLTWVASWADADAIVVEHATYSPEAEGKDLRTWWSIQQPAGVEQARVDAPYSKAPILRRPKSSTVPADKLAALVAGLTAANTAKPRPKQTAVRGDIATSLGIAALAATKTCPARIRIGKKRVTVTIDKVFADGGKSEFPSKDIEQNWDRGSPSSNAPRMTPHCYVHGGGVLVTFRLHASYEGDNYEDRIVVLPGVVLP